MAHSLRCFSNMAASHECLNAAKSFRCAGDKPAPTRGPARQRERCPEAKPPRTNTESKTKFLEFIYEVTEVKILESFSFYELY